MKNGVKKMTKRPIFITSGDIKNPVIERNIEFDWVKGLSYTQKCKRREEFHKAISKFFSWDTILEVSTKSNVDIGIKQSALNLKFNYNNIIESVENVYQTSKIILNNIIVGFKYQDIVFEK